MKAIPPPSEISELKSSLRNMDKYKYVLNHKIHLLQEEIQPKVGIEILDRSATGGDTVQGG